MITKYIYIVYIYIYIYIYKNDLSNEPFAAFVCGKRFIAFFLRGCLHDTIYTINFQKMHRLGSQARSGDLVSEDVCIFTARSAFLELEAGAAGATEVVSRTAAQTLPSTHAGGQDDGSYTNSLKL